MLRIKESEWQRFCDNAKELNFEEYGKREYYSFPDFIGKEYLEITPKSVYIIKYETSNYITSCCLDKLYDLIQQGYVEKVEE